MLDSKIRLCKEHFGIMRPEDWCDVRPEWILRLDGVGPVTLEHIRIYLAARDLTLKDDATPEHWKKYLSAAKIGQTMGQLGEPGADSAIICPFTVLIDSAEEYPFEFSGLKADADQDYRPIIVPTRWQSLGRHPDSYGDYSLDGHVGRVAIERKSPSDAHGTLLGFSDGRRERFERELENLAGAQSAMVVVECSFGQLIEQAPEWGKRTAAQNRKTIFRSVISLQQRYGVPWLFCDTRRLAEVAAFRFLERYHREQAEAEGNRAVDSNETEIEKDGDSNGGEKTEHRTRPIGRGQSVDGDSI